MRMDLTVGLADTCKVQISYAIGISEPVFTRVETYGTAQVDERAIERLIPQVFDLSPSGIIETLQLKRAIYKKTAFGGHFGREDLDFTWEKTDKVQSILKAFTLA